MSKGKKGKKNKKDNRNKFTQHPGSRNKENVPDVKKKPIGNPHENKSRFGRIIENVTIALAAGLIVWGISFIISRYVLSPRHIDIFTSQDGLNEYKDTSTLSTSQDESTAHEYELSTIQHGIEFIGEVAQCDKECQIYFMDSDRNLIINLDNNSDIFMRITDIYVNVIKCTDITEEEIAYVEGVHSGNTEEPIYLKTKIEYREGKMETEIDWKRKGVDDPNSYIEIASNTSEEFILLMDFERQGYYSIEVEFNYMYDGKPRTIRTDPFNFIFLEKDMEDSQLLDL